MLTQEQIQLLKSRYVSKVKFEVNGFFGNIVFDGWEGEWAVTKDGQHVDVFSFRYYNDEDFDQTIHNIFYNTELVTFN